MIESRQTRQKWRIVVVDDNRDIADSLAILLQMEGHDVTVTHDGNAALRAIEHGLPDVVILDIGMPGLDGYEVARRIREQRPTGVRLIAVTGWGQAADLLLALVVGFDDHFTKPIEPDELVDHVNGLR